MPYTSDHGFSIAGQLPAPSSEPSYQVVVTWRDNKFAPWKSSLMEGDAARDAYAAYCNRRSREGSAIDQVLLLKHGVVVAQG